MKFLDKEEYLADAPDVIDQQVNVNHVNCRAGIDTKRRLYIKRVDGGVVAFCHHCGLGGYTVLKNGVKTKLFKKEAFDPKPNAAGTYVIPSGMIPSGRNYDWLLRYLSVRSSVVSTNVLTRGVQQIPSFDGCPLIYFLMHKKGHCYGYQLRWTDGRIPKTKTFLNEKPHVGSWSDGIDEHKEGLIICEDPLSLAILYAEVGADWRVVSTLGTSAKQEFYALTYGYKKYIIWFDDDDAGREGAKKIKERLEFLHYPASIKIMEGVPQPKECFTIAEELSCV